MAVGGSGGARAAVAPGMERPGAAGEGLRASRLGLRGPVRGMRATQGGERSYEALRCGGAAICGPSGAGILRGGREFCGGAGLEAGKDGPMGRV